MFIDEIDGLTRARGNSDTASTAAIRSAFLKEWEAIQRRKSQILVLGTSSNPEAIDPAFLRRLSRRIWIRGPEYRQRISMMKYMLSQTYSRVTDHEIEHLCRHENMERITGFQILMCVNSAIDRAYVDRLKNNRWTTVSASPSCLTAILPSISFIAGVLI